MDDIISVKTVKAAIIITAAVIADKIQSVYIPAPQKLTARCEKKLKGGCLTQRDLLPTKIWSPALAQSRASAYY